MPRFFLHQEELSSCLLTGENARHIGRSLRMKVGEALSLCDGAGTDFDAVITAITEDEVHFRIENTCPSPAEPSVKITLFQGFPKSDKFESIVQKSVELGVCEIFPVLTGRCVARPNSNSAVKKRERFQKVSLEAAKQSGRGIVPWIGPFFSLSDVCREVEKFDAFFLFYESGGESLARLIPESPSSIAIMIGPEGGFDESEVAQLQAVGAKTATLGKRILRTETAPLAALAILHHQLEQAEPAPNPA